MVAMKNHGLVLMALRPLPDRFRRVLFISRQTLCTKLLRSLEQLGQCLFERELKRLEFIDLPASQAMDVRVGAALPL